MRSFCRTICCRRKNCRRKNWSRQGIPAWRPRRRLPRRRASETRRPMFKKILHANDGSEHAFNALALALKIAKQSGAALHMISVEEIDYLPETMEDVREE